MLLVVDTSVILAVLLNEPDKEALIIQTAGTELVAPASLHWEIGNAFSAMLKRKRLTIEEVRKALQSYEQIPIRLVEIDIGEALTIAAHQGIYAYDAYFIVCALQLASAIITLDGRLATAARKLGIEVVEVS